MRRSGSLGRWRDEIDVRDSSDRHHRTTTPYRVMSIPRSPVVLSEGLNCPRAFATEERTLVCRAPMSSTPSFQETVQLAVGSEVARHVHDDDRQAIAHGGWGQLDEHSLHLGG